jgi:Xaa-Pro dipeptidase
VLAYGAGRFPSDVYWLSDWPGGREAYVLIEGGEEPVVFAQLFNHVPMARVLSTIRDVRWAGANTAETVGEALAARGLAGKRIGLVGGVSHRQFKTLAAKLGEDSFTDVSGAFTTMRTIRSVEEIERLRFASKLTDASMEAMAKGLRPGMAEWEIPALIEPVYLKEGGTAGIHFISSMPMREPDFPVPAQFQSNRKLARGDCVITEISGAYWGYSGQIHRTYSLGEGPTPDWAALHQVAVDVFLALEALIKDGVTTREVEEAANLVHRRGYTILDDLLHGTSQTPPIIQTGETKRHTSRDITFRENMTITIQPNVMTRDERMGLQFGETFRVTRDGLERFNAFPRDWVVCAG